MANKRQLKKQIKCVCGDLAGECIVARDMIPGVDFKGMNEIIYKIAELQSLTLARVTFSFDKTPKDFDTLHEYHTACHKYYGAAYSKLRADFNNSVQEIVKDMNAQLPTEQKEANKKAAQA
ncbi:MAG: hypothetical protein NC117_02190 [Pseudoflavonifractor sp.]|nr:hypothetical protein [Pseudoflavonifractor sp.]